MEKQADNEIDFEFNIPVMMCTFTRLDSLIKVFEAVRKVKPPRLYLVSDGPRQDHPEDADKIRKVHEYIESNIDWECEVFKNYSDVNLGCGKRMPTGVSWVFEHEERAIFLEDDCVADTSFFRYAQELLEKYKDNEEIMLISGNNQLAYLNTINDSYGFSKQADIWGWASWRRAWNKYDWDIKSWPDNRNNECWKKYYTLKTRWFFAAQWDLLLRHGYDAWDYQFTYCLGVNNGYCIIPATNLVTNDGFNEVGSTHTQQQPSWMDQTSGQMSFPIKHPESVTWTREYDKQFMKREFKCGLIVHIKHILGMDINKSVFEIFRR